MKKKLSLTNLVQIFTCICIILPTIFSIIFTWPALPNAIFPKKSKVETTYTMSTKQTPNESSAYLDGNETQNETLEPWMVGLWIGQLSTVDYFGNPIKIYWALNISKSGYTKQVVGSSNNPDNPEIEYLNLKYDRRSQQLYYEEGSIHITIKVDSQYKKLYLPSENGTLYLSKDN